MRSDKPRENSNTLKEAYYHYFVNNLGKNLGFVFDRGQVLGRIWQESKETSFWK